MIEEVDRSLREWVGSVVGEVPVSFHVPSDEKAEPGIGLYLLELREKKPPSTGTRAPLQFSLRYLVTTRASEPEQAHNLLGRLVFAAMENPEYSVELEPVPAPVWSAFGVAPQPAFLLDVLLRKERPIPATTLVRQPLIVNTSPLASFYGIVVGPGDMPLAGARVEIPALRLVSTTDRKGAFQFTALPAATALHIVVHARGNAHAFSAAEDPTSHERPFVIQFPVPEE